MALNFDNLAKSGGGGGGYDNTIRPEDWPEDFYHVVVGSAEMKTPKRKTDANGQLLPQKPDYLKLRLDIMIGGKKKGTCWDNLFESEAPSMQFKLRRFIEATNINISGEFELKDLTKLAPGKQMKAKIKVEHDDQYGDSLVVSTFDDYVYIETDQAVANDFFDFSNIQEADSTFVPDFADTDAPTTTPDEY